MNDYETNLLAETSAHIEPILDRLTALELSVSWLLSRQPADDGHRFLCIQANDFEEQQLAPGVVAALDQIRGLYLRCAICSNLLNQLNGDSFNGHLSAPFLSVGG